MGSPIRRDPTTIDTSPPEGSRPERENNQLSTLIEHGTDTAGVRQSLTSTSNNYNQEQAHARDASSHALAPGTNPRVEKAPNPTTKAGTDSTLKQSWLVTDTARSQGASEKGSNVAFRPVTCSAPAPLHNYPTQRGNKKEEPPSPPSSSTATGHPTALIAQEGADRRGEAEPSPTPERTTALNPPAKLVSTVTWASAASMRTSSNPWEVNSAPRRKGGKRYGPPLSFGGDVKSSGDSAGSMEPNLESL